MKKLILLLFVLWAGTSTRTLAQSFDDTDVKKHVDSLFLEYEEYGKLVKNFNDIEVSQAIISKFEELFAPSARVYNDIKQSDRYGLSNTVSTYVEILEEWYPTGLSVQLKTPSGYDRFYKTKKGVYDYEVEILLTKELGGFTKKGEDYRDEELLYFKIGFDKKLTDFKILSVYKEEPTIAEAVEEKTEEEKEDNIIIGGGANTRSKKKKVKNPKISDTKKLKQGRKETRTYIGFFVLPGVTSALGLDEKAIQNKFWDIKESNSITSATELQFSGGITLKHYFSEKIGLATGIGLYNYKLTTSPFSLAPGNNYPITDLDGSLATRFFSASDITESHQLSYINLPIGIEYEQFSQSRKRKLRFFGTVGANIAYLMNHKKSFAMNNVKAYNSYTVPFNNPQNPNDTEYTYDLEFLSQSNEAEATSNEKYWLYGLNPQDVNQPGENLLVDTYETPVSAEPENISIALFAEVGAHYFFQDNIAIFISPCVSLGLTSPFKGTEEDILLKQRKITDGSTNMNYEGFERRNSYEYSSMIAATNTPKNLLIGGKIGLLYKLGGKKRGGNIRRGL